jgi:hypothetical protein
MINFVRGHHNALLSALKEPMAHVNTVLLSEATLVAAIVAKLSQRPEATELVSGLWSRS